MAEKNHVDEREMLNRVSQTVRGAARRRAPAAIDPEERIVLRRVSARIRGEEAPSPAEVEVGRARLGCFRARLADMTAPPFNCCLSR